MNSEMAHYLAIGGFHVTMLDENKRPEVVHFSIFIGVPRGWLKTSHLYAVTNVNSTFLSRKDNPPNVSSSMFSR